MLYLGNLGDGSHLQSLGESLVIGEDVLSFRGGGADEFLNREKDGLSARSCGEEKGKRYTNVFIR